MGVNLNMCFLINTVELSYSKLGRIKFISMNNDNMKTFARFRAALLHDKKRVSKNDKQ